MNQNQAKPEKTRLIFVYNADSGLFNTMSDIAHKIFSPQTYSCNLCAITHDYFKEREQWRVFIENLGVPVEFLHRDEFRRKFPDQTTTFPSVFRLNGKDLELAIATEEINACQSIEDLQKRVAASAQTVK